MKSIQYLLAKGANPHLSDYQKAEHKKAQEYIGLKGANARPFTGYKSAFNNALVSYAKILESERFPEDYIGEEYKRFVKNKDNYPEILKILFDKKGLSSEDMIADFSLFLKYDDSFLKNLSIKVLQKSSPKDWDYKFWKELSERGTLDQLKTAISRSKPVPEKDTGKNILHSYFEKLNPNGDNTKFTDSAKQIEHDQKIKNEYQLHKDKISLMLRVIPISSKDNSGKSISHYALLSAIDAPFYSVNKSYMIMALKDFHVDINAKDNNGWTALHHIALTHIPLWLEFAWKELKANPDIKPINIHIY